MAAKSQLEALGRMEIFLCKLCREREERGPKMEIAMRRNLPQGKGHCLGRKSWGDGTSVVCSEGKEKIPTVKVVKKKQNQMSQNLGDQKLAASRMI